MPRRTRPADRAARDPKYRHYRPKNLAVVRIAGRDYYLGRYNSPESRAKYHRLLAEWRAGGSVAPPAVAPGPDAGVSVAELALAYLRHAEGYYVKDGRPTAEIRNIKVALRPLRRLYGLTPAAEFGPKRLKAVRRMMIGSGLCRTEVNKRVRHVARAFRWAVAEELVDEAVYNALRTVPGLRKGHTEARESEPVRPVSDESVEAIRPHVAPQVWVMVRLQRLTGMRPGEVTSLRTGDVDRSGAVWAFTPRDHKTAHHSKGRTVYLGPRAQEVLSPWLKADPDAYLFSPAEAEAARNAAKRAARKTPLTPSQRARKPKRSRKRAPGARYLVTSYAHAIARACDRAFPHPTLAAIRKKDLTPEQREELKAWRRVHRWHPHRLRHAAATEIRARYGLEAAQLVLGQAQADVTQVYAERDLARAREIMREIG